MTSPESGGTATEKNVNVNVNGEKKRKRIGTVSSHQSLHHMPMQFPSPGVCVSWKSQLIRMAVAFRLVICANSGRSDAMGKLQHVGIVRFIKRIACISRRRRGGRLGKGGRAFFLTIHLLSGGVFFPLRI